MDSVTLYFDEIKHSTERANLLDFGDCSKWVPKSVGFITVFPDSAKAGEIDVPSWFVKNEELEMYVKES